MVFNLLLNVLNLLVSYFKLQRIITSVMGAITLAGSVSGIFTLFVDLGISSIQYRYTYKPDFNTYFGSYFCIKVILIIGNYSIPFIWFLAWGHSFGTVFLAPPPGTTPDIESVVLPVLERLVLISLLTGVSLTVSQIFETNLRTRLKILKAELANFCIQVVNFSLQGYVALSLPLNSTTAQSCTAAITILNINLGMSVARAMLYFLLNLKEKIFTKADLAKIKHYFIDARPLILQSIVSVVCSNIGAILVEKAQGLDTLQYYNFAMSYFVSIFLVAFSLSVQSVFDAIFPKLLTEKKYEEIKDFASQFERYALLLFQFIAIYVILFIPIVLNLLLPKYIPSIGYIDFLVFVPLLDTVLRRYGANLFESGKIALSSKIAVFNLVTSLLMQVFFITILQWGAWGLVFVTLFWQVFGNVLYRYLSKKYFGITSKVKHVKCLSIAALSFAADFGLNQILEPFLGKGYLFLGILSVMLLGVYVGLLLLTKQFTKKDLSVIRSLLNPRSYIQSLKEEIQKEP